MNLRKHLSIKKQFFGCLLIIYWNKVTIYKRIVSALRLKLNARHFFLFLSGKNQYFQPLWQRSPSICTKYTTKAKR